MNASALNFRAITRLETLATQARKRFGFVIHLYLNGTFTSSQRRYIKGSRVGPRGGGTSSYKTLLSTLLVGGGWGGGGVDGVHCSYVSFLFCP